MDIYSGVATLLIGELHGDVLIADIYAAVLLGAGLDGHSRYEQHFGLTILTIVISHVWHVGVIR